MSDLLESRSTIIAILSIAHLLVFVGPGVVATGPLPTEMDVSQNYDEHEAITIADESDFTLYGFTGAGTAEDPYIIQNLGIVSNMYCISIDLSYEDVHFEIRNCYLRSTGDYVSCVYIRDSVNFSLNGLYVEDGTYGINLERCQFANITACRVFDAGTNYHMQGCEYIEMESCVSAAGTTGVDISNTYMSEYVNNRFYSNTNLGMLIENYSHNNTIYGNYFGWNVPLLEALEPEYVEDNGHNNSWDDGVSQGNYYSDDDGSGLKEIPGDADAVDYFPSRLDDSVAPEIHPVSDIHLAVEEQDTTVVAEASDEFPLTFQCYLDGVIHDEGYWMFDAVATEVKVTESGSHNFTILFTDAAGNSASVEIEIQKDAPFPWYIGIAIAAAAVISVLVLVEIRDRRKTS
jgi:hypothetical protein